MSTKTKTKRDLPELNSTLLLRIVEWAEADEQWLADHPDWGLWSQAVWGMKLATEYEVAGGACGTAYCMAGQAAVQSGYRLLFGDLGDYGVHAYQVDSTVHGATAESCVKQEWTGEYDEKGKKVMKDVPSTREPVSDVGQRVLGLVECEADELFDGDNDIDTIKRLANMFAEGRGLPPLFPNHGTSDAIDYSDDDYFQ